MDRDVRVTILLSCLKESTECTYKDRVWLVNTPENTAMVAAWRGRKQYADLTLFSVPAASTREEQFFIAFDAIELHYNETTQAGPWRRLEVVGIDLSEAIRQQLLQLDIFAFVNESNQFSIIYPKNLDGYLTAVYESRRIIFDSWKERIMQGDGKEVFNEWHNDVSIFSDDELILQRDLMTCLEQWWDTDKFVSAYLMARLLPVASRITDNHAIYNAIELYLSSDQDVRVKNALLQIVKEDACP